MNELKKTLRDISNLKIQGAHAVAMESVKALKYVLASSKSTTVHKLIVELILARNSLVATRPTEPCMRNALSFVFHDLDYEDLRKLKLSLIKSMQGALTHLRSAEKQISEIGAMKIRNGMVIFTHCHSSFVVRILKEAKRTGKRFTVHNTETRPLFQGRKTSRELASFGIKVTHYVDSAVRLALKKADLMLIGADAITSEGKVINKIGSELFAETAERFGIPVYSCTDSWKFDYDTLFGFEEPIEKRDKREVWKEHIKNIIVDNHAFEIIDSNLITGVITEEGIYKPEVLVDVLKDKSPWMFRKNE